MGKTTLPLILLDWQVECSDSKEMQKTESTGAIGCNCTWFSLFLLFFSPNFCLLCLWHRPGVSGCRLCALQLLHRIGLHVGKASRLQRIRNTWRPHQGPNQVFGDSNNSKRTKRGWQNENSSTLVGVEKKVSLQYCNSTFLLSGLS